MITIDRVSKEVSQELNIDPYLVEMIAKFQFKYLRDILKECRNEPIILIHIGKFLMKDSIRDRIEEGDLKLLEYIENERANRSNL